MRWQGTLQSLFAAAVVFCSAGNAVPAHRLTWETLNPATCVTLAKANIHPKLGATWTTFQPDIRACPLASSHGQARVWLLTVFAKDYLGVHPETTDWPTFPRPMLMDRDGTCLASLPELYPFDEPRTLHLDFARFTNGMPARIRVRISNPAAGGNYTLPLLRWAPEQRAYVADHDTPLYTSKDMTCPI